MSVCAAIKELFKNVVAQNIIDFITETGLYKHL